MLKYKKGFSKEPSASFPEKFKLNQAAFNRPYKLKTPLPPHIENNCRR